MLWKRSRAYLARQKTCKYPDLSHPCRCTNTFSPPPCDCPLSCYGRSARESCFKGRDHGHDVSCKCFDHDDEYEAEPSPTTTGLREIDEEVNGAEKAEEDQADAEDDAGGNIGEAEKESTVEDLEEESNGFHVAI
jgi:hypothetical protein